MTDGHHCRIVQEAGSYPTRMWKYVDDKEGAAVVPNMHDAILGLSIFFFIFNVCVFSLFAFHPKYTIGEAVAISAASCGVSFLLVRIMSAAFRYSDSKGPLIRVDNRGVVTMPDGFECEKIAVRGVHVVRGYQHSVNSAAGGWVYQLFLVTCGETETECRLVISSQARWVAVEVAEFVAGSLSLNVEEYEEVTTDA